MRAALVATSVWKPTTVREDALDKLGLEERAADAHKRLVREHDGSFSIRVHVAGKSKVGKAVEERLAEIGECRHFREDRADSRCRPPRTAFP